MLSGGLGLMNNKEHTADPLRLTVPPFLCLSVVLWSFVVSEDVEGIVDLDLLGSRSHAISM